MGTETMRKCKAACPLFQDDAPWVVAFDSEGKEMTNKLERMANTYLTGPFGEKDSAKALGARRDGPTLANA